ncbi:MAG: hypothetical protein H6622_06030 [Halobacteriovoraceae bacterium]|nr:hypothetical protein [Halobacteriovoraceae bacterium]
MQDNVQKTIQRTTLKSLIELGSNGHFPLFMTDWLKEYFNSDLNTPASKIQNRKIKELFRTLERYETLERKRIFMLSLECEDRFLLIREFFSQVEDYILNKSPELQ